MGDQYLIPPSEATGSEVWRLESCGFTWLFDVHRRRFRRIPRGAAVNVPVPPSAWAPYHNVEIHERRMSFAVSLDARATRVLRCSFHVEPCSYCGSGNRRRQSPDELEGAGGRSAAGNRKPAR